MKRKVSALLIAFLFCTAARAQNNCECRQAEQLRAPMGFHFNAGNLDSAKFYTAKLLTFPDNACKIYYQDWMAQIALGQKKAGEARSFLEAESKLLKETKCSQKLYIRYYNTLSKLYQELNETDSFMTACFSEIDAAQKENDYFGLSRAQADVASVFSRMGQTEKAIGYYRQAMEAANMQIKVPSLVASVGTRLADEYLELFTRTGTRSYADSAALLARQAMDTARAHHDMLAYLEANKSLSSHALLTGNYQQAILYADEIIRSSPRGVHLFDRLTHTGFSKKSEALYKQQDFAGAEQYADSALLYAEAFNPQMMITAYNNVYLAARANGNTAKSLAAYEHMIVLRDSLQSVKKDLGISELEKKYNQAKNENTIKDLAKKKQLYLMLAIAGILAALAFWFFLRQQSLKHKQNILETEQRLNRARMNPHFFFNTLAALQKFAVREKDGQALATNLSRFSHIMRETLESTYKDYVTIEQEMEFLNEYLEVQKIRFPQTFSYDISAADDLDTDELLIPSMIIQPFIENSIEHGFAGIDYPGRVVIQFATDNRELLIRITDNGKGLELQPRSGSNEHISRASQIIKDRIYLLNLRLKTKAGFSIANNENGEGVMVKIHLPLFYKNNKNS